jgi:hypothetical protein
MGGLGRALVLVLVALLGGVVGYQLGLNQGLAAEGARYVYGPGFGFGFGGFFLFFIILILIFAAARPRWGGYPRGHAGPPWRSRWYEGFEDWHRQAHGEPRSTEAPTPEHDDRR